MGITIGATQIGGRVRSGRRLYKRQPNDASGRVVLMPEPAEEDQFLILPTAHAGITVPGPPVPIYQDPADNLWKAADASSSDQLHTAYAIDETGGVLTAMFAGLTQMTGHAMSGTFYLAVGGGATQTLGTLNRPCWTVADADYLYLHDQRAVDTSGPWRATVLDFGPFVPATPNPGDTYIIGTGALGAWAGHDSEIGTWSGAAWEFRPADQDEIHPVAFGNLVLKFNGATWVNIAAPPDPAVHTADATARGALALPPEGAVVIQDDDGSTYVSDGAALVPLGSSGATLVDTVTTLAGLVATARVGQAFDVYADPIVTNNGRYLAHGAVGAAIGDPAVAIVR